MDIGSENYCRFLNGDNDGLREIIRIYKDGLTVYLNGFVHNISVAEELCEDTFVKLCIKKPKDGKKGSFKTWLYTIGRNTAVDYLRKNRKHITVPVDECAELAEPLVEPYINIIQSDRKQAVYKALREIKTEYGQVLYLRYFENFKNREIAVIMKKSVHNIETLVYRAEKSLKKQLERNGFVYEEL